MKFNFQALILIFTVCLFSSINISCTYSLSKHAFIVNESVLKKRVLQTQRFENIDKKQLISAIVGVMQDLNFKFEEGDNNLGVLVGSKRYSFIQNVPVTHTEQRYETRSQVINGQLITTPIVVNVPVTVFVPMTFIEETRMSIIIYPILQKKNQKKEAFSVRTTLQKIIWNKSTGQITQAEPFGDSAFYKDFSSKLSKSVFLETHL